MITIGPSDTKLWLAPGVRLLPLNALSKWLLVCTNIPADVQQHTICTYKQTFQQLLKNPKTIIRAKHLAFGISSLARICFVCFPAV